MKTTHVVLLFLATVLFPRTASSQVYEVIDLSRQTGGYSEARAINDSGVVVVNTYTRAYLWRDSVMTNLGTLGGSSTLANAINARGDVVGYSSMPGDTISGAFLWKAGGMTALPKIPGDRFSSAEGINDSDEIVGYERDHADSVQRALMWKDGVITDLGSLGGDSRAAFAINNSRQIAGDAYLVDNSTSHGFLWENGSMADIGTLGGYATAALDINESGVVVGYSSVNFSESRAFIYQGGTMSNLGPNGYAEGINDLGQVVGWGYNLPTSSNHAFHWSQGVLTDLNDVIDPTSGWVLNFARDINNKGEIVGVGTRGGQPVPFLLVPASIILTNPKSGTLWITDEEDTIRWKSGLPPGSSVILHYSYDGGQTWNILASNLAADSGKYVWTIPDTITAQARIMITSLADFSKNDTSDAFTLRPYVLSKRSPLGQSIAYTPSKDQWLFGNYDIDIWPSGWYERFDYLGLDSISGKSYLSGGLYAGYVFLTAKRSDFPDWPSFARTFTPEVCYINLSLGAYSPTAVAKWASLKGDWHGSCFGISTANAIAFRNHPGFETKYPGFPSFTDPHDIGADMRVIPVVNELFTHQLGNPHASYREDEGEPKTPTQTLNELKRMLLSDDEPIRTLGLLKNTGTGGGHSILPYELRQDETSGNLWYLSVYDNNFPTRYDLVITIDTAQYAGKGSWDFPEHPGWGGGKGFFLMDPALSYLDNPTFPAIDTKTRISPFAAAPGELEMTTTPSAFVRISDAQGHETGYFDSLVHADIPGSHPRFFMNGSSSPPYSYQLPNAPYAVTLNQFTGGTSQAFFFTTHATFSAARADAESLQTDRLFFDGSLSVVNPDPAAKSFDLTSIPTEFTLWQGQYQRLERVFSVQSLSVSLDDSVRMENIGTNGLKLQYFGSASKSYNLIVELAAYSGARRFTHASIPLAGNSSHIIQPNWSTLGSGALTLLIDNGNDGAIDDSLTLANELTGVRGSHPMPGGYRLAQNYPNPFNPRTTIEYDLPKRSRVRLAIYDLFGQEIALLVDGSEDAGYKSVEWNASGVASGVYFCRLQAGGVTLTRKLALIK